LPYSNQIRAQLKSHATDTDLSRGILKKPCNSKSWWLTSRRLEVINARLDDRKLMAGEMSSVVCQLSVRVPPEIGSLNVLVNH